MSSDCEKAALELTRRCAHHVFMVLFPTVQPAAVLLTSDLRIIQNPISLSLVSDDYEAVCNHHHYFIISYCRVSNTDRRLFTSHILLHLG